MSFCKETKWAETQCAMYKVQTYLSHSSTNMKIKKNMITNIRSINLLSTCLFAVPFLINLPSGLTFFHIAFSFDSGKISSAEDYHQIFIIRKYTLSLFSLASAHYFFVVLYLMWYGFIFCCIFICSVTVNIWTSVHESKAIKFDNGFLLAVYNIALHLKRSNRKLKGFLHISCYLFWYLYICILLHRPILNSMWW